MDTLWARKSIGGHWPLWGDEKTARLRRTDKSRTLKFRYVFYIRPMRRGGDSRTIIVRIHGLQSIYELV